MLEIRSLLSRDFGDDLPVSENELMEALRQRIIYLLLHDLEKLWNILYRIDVNEKKVKALFDAGKAEEIAPGMAQLIFDRMAEKAKTRAEYRNNGGKTDF